MQSSTFDSIMSSTRWAAVLTAAGLAEKRVHAARNPLNRSAKYPPLVPVPGDIGA